MDQGNVLQNMVRPLDTGRNKFMQVVLDSTLTAGGVVCKVISIPDGFGMARIYPTAQVRVAFGELPAAITTATFIIGSIVNAAEWGTFALDNGTSRTLQIATASTSVVNIEIY
jgi:hypothetical protein